MVVQDIIAILIASSAAAYAGYAMWRTMNSGRCGGCSKSGTSSAGANSAGRGVIRKPLVTQVGLPSTPSQTNSD